MSNVACAPKIVIKRDCEQEFKKRRNMDVGKQKKNINYLLCKHELADEIVFNFAW